MIVPVFCPCALTTGCGGVWLSGLSGRLERSAAADWPPATDASLAVAAFAVLSFSGGRSVASGCLAIVDCCNCWIAVNDAPTEFTAISLPFPEPRSSHNVDHGTRQLS